MRAFVALCVISSACAAPQLLAGHHAGLLAHNGAGVYAGQLGYAGLAGHAAGVYAAAPVVAAAAPIALPAPYAVDTQAEGVTSLHQPASIVTKEVHLGQTSFVSGYATTIHKPPTPHLPIQVPTVLRGSQSVNAPIVKTQTQIHTVNEPVYVERRVEVPYDVPVLREQIVEVPTPVHVDAPYNVPYPVAVQGEPIIKKTVAPAIVTHSNHGAAPAYGYAAAPVAHGHAAYAAAPIAHGHAAYAAAPVAAGYHAAWPAVAGLAHHA